MSIDTVGNLITRIRNAYSVNKPNLEVTHSVMNENVLQTLKDNGFIEDFKVFKLEGRKIKGINITLKYVDGVSSLSHIQRVSKPSLRMYAKSRDLKPVLGGLGVYVVSTPRGIMSSKEARKKHLGGEVLFVVY
ncbi:MAG: small subunit ribosomal protein [Patescibacteria group bacterium]|nr:small subunit ribosomal protein [Patescibacteria group bacterium]